MIPKSKPFIGIFIQYLFWILTIHFIVIFCAGGIIECDENNVTLDFIPVDIYL